MFKFKNGDEVKDIITGFRGIVIRRTEWLNMCNTYGVQPKKLRDGIPQETHAFDEPQLVLVKQKTVSVKKSPTGGPENSKVEKTSRQL